MPGRRSRPTRPPPRVLERATTTTRAPPRPPCWPAWPAAAGGIRTTTAVKLRNCRRTTYLAAAAEAGRVRLVEAEIPTAGGRYSSSSSRRQCGAATVVSVGGEEGAGGERLPQQHSGRGRSRQGRRGWAGDRSLPAAETGRGERLRRNCGGWRPCRCRWAAPQWLVGRWAAAQLWVAESRSWAPAVGRGGSRTSSPGGHGDGRRNRRAAGGG